MCIFVGGAGGRSAGLFRGFPCVYPVGVVAVCGSCFACEVSDGVVVWECVEVSSQDGYVCVSFFGDAFDVACFVESYVFFVATPCEVCAGEVPGFAMVCYFDRE